MNEKTLTTYVTTNIEIRHFRIVRNKRFAPPPSRPSPKQHCFQFPPAITGGTSLPRRREWERLREIPTQMRSQIAHSAVIKMPLKFCAKLHRKENCYQKFVKLTIYETERSQKDNSCQPVRPSFHVVNINFRRLLFLFDVPFLFPGFILSINASFSFSYCVKYLHDISNTPQGNKTKISRKGPHYYLYTAIHSPGAILVVYSMAPRQMARGDWSGPKFVPAKMQAHNLRRGNLKGNLKDQSIDSRPPDPCGMAGVYGGDLTRLMCVKTHI